MRCLTTCGRASRRGSRSTPRCASPKFAHFWIDPYSSAAWFAGWAEPVRADELWKRELVRMDPPTKRATVWLLTTGWKTHGLLRFDERPG